MRRGYDCHPRDQREPAMGAAEHISEPVTVARIACGEGDASVWREGDSEGDILPGQSFVSVTASAKKTEVHEVISRVEWLNRYASTGRVL